MAEAAEAARLLSPPGPAASSWLALRGVPEFGRACALFIAFALRIYLPPLWGDGYLPIISPIYRQQEHWRASAPRAAAVCAHVACGIGMLAAAVHQLDAPGRHARPARHRLVGRLYVACGLGAIASLRWLRGSSGAGSARRADPLMSSFIDAASAAWLCATGFALHAIAVRRDERSHSAAMALSSALAALPILQRLLNALLVAPLAMSVRWGVCLVAWGTPPWRARWGPPGSV